jgi:hypothetical protein
MSRAASVAVLLLTGLIGGESARAAPRDALIRAREAYNDEHYDRALTEARTALSSPDVADAARLIIARAHLERFRQSAEADDLNAARDALRAIDPSRLNGADHAELLVGLGEWLFFSERFGAAAELFADALARADFGRTSLSARARALDWWASALDRHAQGTPSRRAVLYNDMLARLDDELRRDPGSPSANYWMVVAARGTGDLERAWQTAMAGWVRASLAPDRGASLRADIDRFVLTAIIPDRARRAERATHDQRQAAADAMVTEWERFKADWEGGGS